MPIKDVLTLLIGVAALTTSVSVALFNYRVQRAREAEDVRKAFGEAVAGLQAARADWETLRDALGDGFEAAGAVPRRVAIVARRNLYLSRALDLHRGKAPPLTSADAMILASALITSGRTAAAIPFYRLAADRAGDDHDRATAQRVLGRATMLAGDFTGGRAEMIAAAERFLAMADDPGFDVAEMMAEAADTHRRLVDVSDRLGRYDMIDADMAEMARLCAPLGGPIPLLAAAVAERVARHRGGDLPSELPPEPSVTL